MPQHQLEQQLAVWQPRHLGFLAVCIKADNSLYFIIAILSH